MDIKDKIKLSQNIAAIAGVFCVVVALLLLLNYWQVTKSDPIDSKALQALVDRLKEDPNSDELKTEIRNFDLLARKAYFNSRWQIRTGTWMLLIGAVVLFVALRVNVAAQSKISEPDTSHENEISGRILAQKGILIVGAVVIVLALAASYATVNHLDSFDKNAQLAESDAKKENQEIPIIEVGKNPESIAEKEQTVDDITEEASTTAVAEPDSATEQLPADNDLKEAPKTVAAALTLSALQNNHNTFRGPLGQGIIYHKNIPVQWDGTSGQNIRWKVPVPKHGYNSPIVWGNKIWVSGADATSREIYCYDKTSGELLWTARADNIQGSPAKMPRVTEDTGLAASTLATDGQNVYAIFATGDVIAIDVSGKRIWARNLGVPDNHYGHSSSLMLWDKKLFVQYDTNKGGMLLALDTATGNTVWETTRDAKISWASPVLARVNERYQIILTADPIVAGYDIANGKELWAVDAMMGEVGPSVAFSNGMVYAANEYARLAAINPVDGAIVWENDEYMPEAASPLAHKGLLFIATSYGVLVCYDANSGEQYWEHDVGATLYSSPLVADGKLFMMDNDGIMRVYEFAREMKLLAENELGESAGTTPAFDDGHIYIRGENNLYCIGK